MSLFGQRGTASIASFERSAGGWLPAAPVFQSHAFIGAFVVLGLVSAWSMAGERSIAAASECRADPIALIFGAESSVSMATTSGTACGIAVRRFTAPIDAIEITTAPKFGTLAERGRSGVIYRSRASFKGEDSFAFVMRGKDGNGPGEQVFRVIVTVR